MTLKFKNTFFGLKFFVVMGMAPVFASKPVEERSAEACRLAFRVVSEFHQAQAPAASTLIPLSTMLSSRKSDYIPIVWRRGVVYDKKMPTQGLAEMYSTAAQAADELIRGMNIEAVTPSFRRGNPFDAADETLKLMESKDPPEYIRNAVIIRDGVVMVAPLLKREAKKSSKTGKSFYTPIVVKGHQDIRDADILQAGFLAWGLEVWQGQLPKEVSVFLKPMAPKRAAVVATDNEFHVVVADIIPRVEQIYENFMTQAEKAGADYDIIAKTRPERRCTECDLSPWASHFREKLENAKDISMIPFPPQARQSKALKDLGLGTTEELAKLKINSPEFADVAMRANISLERLRYFVTHSIAKESKEVVVKNSFADPFKNVDVVVDVDFEDMLSTKVLSGVYLFGVRFSDSTQPFKKVHKEFLWAEKAFTQDTVDEAWVRFLKLFKTHPKLKGKTYKITIYSKHEIVKAEQQFDILKQAAKKFTAAEKKSKFYSEITVDGKQVGRLIRRKDIFAKHPELKPEEVFAFMDNSIDILDYIRENLAFPSWSNGLKKLLPYANTDEAAAIHAKGADGMQSLAWAKEYYETMEQAMRDKIQQYNGADIDGNAVMLAAVRKHADMAPDKRVIWNEKMKPEIDPVNAAIALKSKVGSLNEKSDLLEALLGKKVSSLTETQRNELLDILDRTEYLDARETIKEGADEVDAVLRDELQDAKYEHWSKRTQALSHFAKQINPGFGSKNHVPANAFADITSRPDTFLTAKHVQELLAVSQMREHMEKLVKPIQKPLADVADYAEVPQRILNAMPNLTAQAPELSEADLLKLWKGLYLDLVFPR